MVREATACEISKDQETIGKLRVLMFYLTRERPTGSGKHESVPTGRVTSLPDVWCPVDTEDMLWCLTLETHSVSSKEIKVQRIGLQLLFLRWGHRPRSSWIFSWADGSRVEITMRWNNIHKRPWPTEEGENANFHVWIHQKWLNDQQTACFLFWYWYL